MPTSVHTCGGISCEESFSLLIVTFSFFPFSSTIDEREGVVCDAFFELLWEEFFTVFDVLTLTVSTEGAEGSGGPVSLPSLSSCIVLLTKMGLYQQTSKKP